MMGRIDAICLSERKGIRKTQTTHGRLVENFGLEGDAHGGPWHRQVSLLSTADIDMMRQSLPGLPFGAFAENIALSGVDVAGLGLGSRLRLGADAEVTLSQRGKTCHSRCAIYHQTGDCIMPRRGVFAEVLVAGDIRPGDPAEVLEAVSLEVSQAAVLTVSGTCPDGGAKGGAGPRVAALMASHLGARLHAMEALSDEEEQISERLRHYADEPHLDLVLIMGGTGLPSRDVTAAIRGVIDRAAPGLDEVMRTASGQWDNLAKLPHAAPGIRGRTLIIAVPRSPRSVEKDLCALLPALSRELAQLRGNRSQSENPALLPRAGGQRP